MIQTAKVPTNCTITAVATSWMRAVTQSDERAPAPAPSTTLPAVTSSSIGTTLQPAIAPGHRRADGEPVDQERAGVVEQALAFEDHQQPVRRPELPQHRRRGRRVGRRDDGAEGDRRGPGHLGHQPPGHHRHRRHGERDGAQRETGDRPPVLAQVARRGVEGRVEQHRRHEQRERQLRIEHHVGAPGSSASAAPGEREQRRVGRADPPGQRRQAGAGRGAARSRSRRRARRLSSGGS